MTEGQGLDEDFVQLESMQHLESVEVPNNNVSLKNKLVCENTESLIGESVP